MIPNDNLSDIHQLVHSLSKSEKRFFKLYASRLETRGSKKYLDLFDCIEKQKVYDEAKILKKNTQFSKAQLPNLKQHLYNQVLKSLSIVSANTTADIRLHYQIGQAQLLYNKCLYHQSFKMMEKAKKAAIRNDRSILLLDILELEKMIMIHTVSTRTQERINDITSQADQVSKSIRRMDTFSNLSLKMNAFYMNLGFVRNRHDYEEVRRFFFQSLPSYKESQLSFHDKLYLYYSYTGYFFFISDFREGYFYARRMVELFETHAELIPDKTEMYIKAINNLLVAQNKLFLFDEFTEAKKKLNAIKRYPPAMLNENVKLNLFKAIYIHEINRHFMMGEFRSGTRIVNRLEAELHRFLPKLDRNTILIFYYKIACLYFGSANYNQSLKWLNRVINSPQGGLREDLHTASRILALICHYELGSLELLDYSIRAVYRFLLKSNDLSKYHRHIIKFLKNLGGGVTQKDLIKKFTALRNELQPLETQRYEKRQFLYFDIISWLECKIANRPVEDIIKEKFVKRTRPAGAKGKLRSFKN